MPWSRIRIQENVFQEHGDSTSCMQNPEKLSSLVRNPLEGAQVSLWESPDFDSRDALSHVLTGTFHPQISFGLIMNGLEGEIPILQVHSSPKHPLERSQESFAPSTSAAPALPGSIQGWIIGRSREALKVSTWFNSTLQLRGGHGPRKSSSKTGSGKSDSLAEPLRMLFICEILFSSSSKVLLLPGASPVAPRGESGFLPE